MHPGAGAAEAIRQGAAGLYRLVRRAPVGVQWVYFARHAGRQTLRNVFIDYAVRCGDGGQ